MANQEALENRLDRLQALKSELESRGALQGCWIAQYRPAGTARFSQQTSTEYWQVRSREPIFDGRKTKHLNGQSLSTYRERVERGRELDKVEREIKKVEAKLARLRSGNE